MPKDTELKVGDWVHVRIPGIYTFGEPPHQIESIDGEKYIIVQIEKGYKHRLTVKKEQLKKL